VCVAPREPDRLVRRHDAEGLSRILNQSTAAQEYPPYGQWSSPILRRLAATGDVVRALDTMYAYGLDPAYCVVRQDYPSIYNVLTLLPDTLHTFIANGDVEGIVASVEAGLRPFKGTDQRFNWPTERSLAVRLLPASIADVIVTVLDLRGTAGDDFLPNAQTQCIPQARAARAELLAQLPPLGDVASLVAQLPLRPTPWHWQRLVAAVSTLPGPRTQALLALCAVHRADVAVAAFASQSRLDTPHRTTIAQSCISSSSRLIASSYATGSRITATHQTMTASTA
jgi:hypothetical protein